MVKTLRETLPHWHRLKLGQDIKLGEGLFKNHLRGSFHRPCFFLKKMGHPRPLLSFIFGLFKQTLKFYNIISEKCPSSIRYRDSNPRPLGRESPPITTRPGLLLPMFMLPIVTLPCNKAKGTFKLGVKWAFCNWKYFSSVNKRPFYAN